MNSVRGKDKAAGEYKTIPNAIGKPGATLETAKFIPIMPDQLEDGMAAWEKYLHSQQSNTLVQQGLSMPSSNPSTLSLTGMDVWVG